jgi:hypothetical protein
MILLALTLGCASKAVKEAQRLEGNYTLGDPGSSWRVVKSGGADFAYQDKGNAAVIYADSNCGSRFEDSRLDDLAQHLSFGVRLGEPEDERSFELDGRSAYSMRAQGELDGVPIELATTVLKKDMCVYDIVLIAPRGERFEAAHSGYLSVVSGFRTHR